MNSRDALPQPQSIRWFFLACAAALAIAGPVTSAGEVKHVVKKTMDGRCLAPGHPQYWETKIYVKKNSMRSCVASGGKEDKA